MKWTDDIVMLLITVVSYVGEDANCTNDGNKRKDWILYKNMDEEMEEDEEEEKE